MSIFFLVFPIVIDYIILYSYLNSIFTYKFQKNMYRIIYCVIATIIIFLINLLNSPSLNLLGSMIMYISFILLFFNAKIIVKIFYIIVYILFSMLGDFFASSIMMFAFSLSFDTIAQNETLYFLCAILSKIFLSILAVLCVNFYMKNKRIQYKSRMRKTFFVILFLPLSSLLLLIGVFSSPNLIDHLNFFSMIGLIGLLIANLYALHLLSKLEENYEKDNVIKILKEREKMNNHYYDLVNENYEKDKIMFHDFKKHINMIDYFVKNNEYNELDNYIKLLNLEETNKHLITGIKALDLIFNLPKYKHNYIDIRLNIQTNNLSKINIYDQNLIFSNLIDNAFEHLVLSNENDKYISIEIKEKNKNLIINIINLFDRLVLEDDSVIKSKQYHGYGLKIIDKIVKKYNGSFISQVDKTKKEYSSVIIIPLI